jgi:hypothetical protein
VLVLPCPTIISPNAVGRYAVRRYIVGWYVVRRYVVLTARPIVSVGSGRVIRAVGVGSCLLEDREELRRLFPDRTDRLLAHPLPSVIIAV